MWFWLALITLLCWSGSDLFSKIGCRDPKDTYSHLKMVMAVGVVMGLHAAYEAVSYTHLDVYKRQGLSSSPMLADMRKRTSSMPSAAGSFSAKQIEKRALGMSSCRSSS